jgi:hypothetical protein
LIFLAPKGPVLVDCPEEAPEGAAVLDEGAVTGMVCPINLPKTPDANSSMSDLGKSLMQEIDSLAPWCDLAVRTRGRTTVGPSGLDIEDAATFFADFLEDQNVAARRDDMAKGRVLKLAYEDLKVYYTEEITAQPGYSASLKVENWLFNETVFGSALWTLRVICRGSDDEYYRYLGGNSIVPDRQVHGSKESTQLTG